MASSGFKTVPEEQIGLAVGVEAYFLGLGYVVRRERSELGFPSTPALWCRRGQTTLVVELGSGSPLTQVGPWVAFGRSQAKDFRVAVACASGAYESEADRRPLREAGVGLLSLGDGRVTSHLDAMDLSLNLQLPDLSKEPSSVRGILGASFETISKGHWREGFGDACVAFETECRKYLGRNRNRLQIQVKFKGNTVVRSIKSTDWKNKPMGALAGIFGSIVFRNKADDVLGKALAALNKDRIRVAHKVKDGRSEASLRRNVGRQLWRLLEASRYLD